MLKNMHISLYEIIVRGRIKTLIYLQNVRKACSQTRNARDKDEIDSLSSNARDSLSSNARVNYACYVDQ